MCVVSAVAKVKPWMNFGLYGSTVVECTQDILKLLDTDGRLRLSNYTFPSILKGEKSLSLIYRSLPKQTTTPQSVRSMIQKLGSLNLIDTHWRSLNSSFTFFKLPEWMQVEVIQLFGNTMEHTPWYRFPFFDVLKVYFQTLRDETNFNSEKEGLFSTLFSSAFITDLVPGIAMFVGFLQMSALAYPLRLFCGESYENQEIFEKVLISTPQTVNWSVFGQHIISRREILPGLWELIIPSFKPFTNSLIQIARLLPTSTILQISNCSEIQVRIELSSNNNNKKGDRSASAVDDDGDGGDDEEIQSRIEFIRSLSICRVISTFKFPKVGSFVSPTHVALAVPVVQLISLINLCKREKLSIYQIYDFYGG
jgi:hypothetical protein